MKITKEFYFDIKEGTRSISILVDVDDSCPNTSIGDIQSKDYGIDLKVRVTPYK